MKGLATLAAAALALITLAPASEAASFNCGGQITYTERTICDNPDLSSADDRMSSLYFSIYNSAGPRLRPAIQRQQLRWLGRRDGCSANVNCLRAAYYRRISTLNEAGAY